MSEADLKQYIADRSAKVTRLTTMFTRARSVLARMRGETQVEAN